MASKSFHDAHSNTYDRMASKSTFNIAKTFIPNLSPPITPDSYILDNACGSGIITSLIKSQYPYAHIKGADLAPGMIDVLKARAKENKWENIETDVLDVRDLKTLKDDTFTHVITNFGFGSDVKDLSGPLRAAKEMYRVLKKGGGCVVTTWAQRNFTEAFENTARIIRPDEKPFSWDIPLDWERGSWLMRRLEDAGFGYKVSVKSVEGKMEAGSLDELVENMLLFKDMFYKGYSSEEIKGLHAILRAEVQKLKDFRETKDGVEIAMIAWVGMAWK